MDSAPSGLPSHKTTLALSGGGRMFETKGGPFAGSDLLRRPPCASSRGHAAQWPVLEQRTVLMSAGHTATRDQAEVLGGSVAGD